MLLRRQGYPEESEIVFCTVTKIQYHAITVQLDEYDKQGLIPISEVSPGRIRNIRDFVEEGKKVVCKVLKIDQERGQIDVSLRRVNESQRRAKADAIKQEQKAEKIVASLSEKLGKKQEELYPQIASKLLTHYDYLYIPFEAVVEKSLSLESLGLDKDLAKKLEDVIRDKIKPKQVSIIVKITLQTYDPDGLELIKQGFASVAKIDETAQLSYLGGGHYRLLICAKDYKIAESSLKSIQESLESFFEKKGSISFERQEQ